MEPQSLASQVKTMQLQSAASKMAAREVQSPAASLQTPLRWTSMVNLRGNEQELKDKKRRSTQTTSCLQASTSFARLPASSTTGCIVALL